jgi:hypothetical protein
MGRHGIRWKLAMPWLEPLVVFSLSGAAFFCAARAERCWVGVVLAGVSLIAVCYFAEPWISRRTNAALLGAALPAIATPLCRRASTRLLRVGLAICAIGALVHSSWLDTLAPALAREELAQLRTQISPRGYCTQTTSYTCGPAAAVTAARLLGFAAEEGDLALLAHSSWHTGTDPDELASALEFRFREAGLNCRRIRPKTLDELAAGGLTLTVVRLAWGLDHWITVLEVSDREVRFADPLSGELTEPRGEFEARWKRITLRVWKDGTLQASVRP